MTEKMQRNRRRIFTAVLVSELLLLLHAAYVYGAQRARGSPSPHFDGAALRTTQTTEDGDEAWEGGAIDAIFDGVNRIDRTIASPGFTLDRGIYRAVVRYRTNTPYGSTTSAHLEAVCENRYPWMTSEYIRLMDREGDESVQEASVFVYVDKNGAAGHLEMAMDDDCYFYLEVLSADVVYFRGRTVLTELLKLLFWFALIDLVLFIFFFTKESATAWLQKNGILALSFAAILLIVMLPETLDRLLTGYDLRYHYYRIHAIAEGLLSGSFPVKLQPGWQNGYGYAAGIFYGDLLLYFPAALLVAGFKIDFCYKCYVLLINAITLFNAYLCCRKISRDRYIALFGSASYMLALPRLVAMYTRSALGAYSALAFLPLVLLGLWAIYDEAAEDDEKGWLYLAAGVTGILGTQVLGTVITACFILLWLLFSLRKTCRRETLHALGKALAAALLLNLYYLVPFADAYRSMEMRVSNDDRMLYRFAAYPAQLFSLAYDATVDVRADLAGMWHDMPMTLGPAAAIVLFLALCLILRERDAAVRKGTGKVLLLTCIALWMASSLFPYAWMEAQLPALYYYAGHLEFAFRFLSMAAALVMLLLTMTLTAAKRYLNRRQLLAAGAALMLLFCYQGGAYLFAYDNEMEPFVFDRSVQDLDGSTYNGEYDPEGFEAAGVKRKIEVSDEERVRAEVLERRGTTISAYVENDAKNEETLDFPLIHYKGYRAFSDDGALRVSDGDNFRVRVTLPAGYHGNLTVRFVEPWYWRLAEVVSLAALIALCVTGRKRRRLARKTAAAG